MHLQCVLKTFSYFVGGLLPKISYGSKVMTSQVVQGKSGPDQLEGVEGIKGFFQVTSFILTSDVNGYSVQADLRT